MPVVVDLPLVPATPIRSGAALNRSASRRARVVIGAPTRRAAWTSGTVSSTAAETTSTWSARVTPLPSCGCSPMPLLAQEIEFGAVAALVERAVGAFDPAAARLDDQGQRRHAATADAAEEVIAILHHGRGVQAA